MQYFAPFTLQLMGPRRPQTPGLIFFHLLFQNSLLLFKVLKALHMRMEFTFHNRMICNQMFCKVTVLVNTKLRRQV
jgi:hypothetical protein